MNEDNGLEHIKRFVYRHFEQLLVVVLVASLIVIHWFVEDGMSFLSFYYLPVIAAGFLVGQRMAVWAAVLVILLVGFVEATHGLNGASLDPDSLRYIVPWAVVLLLTGLSVGALAEQRRARTDEVRSTYLAMLELLSLHVDSSDRLRRGHSYRVGERAVALARELGLNDEQQENLRVAGLLHEIGPRDPRIMRLVGDVPARAGTRLGSMRSALRLVDEYSHYHEVVSTGWPVDDTRISLGAKILAVADAYETLQTPTPTRQGFAPWTALEEIERGVGNTFATEVVRALRKVTSIEKAELDSAADQPALRVV